MASTEMDTAQDLVRFLTDQHEQLKALMPQVLKADGDGRVEAFAEVRRMLAVHEALEQESVHVLARTEIGDDAAAPRVAEESEAESAIADLEQVDPDSDDFNDQYQALASDVVAHAEHEEHEEFNQLRGELTDQAKAKVALAQRLLGGQGLEGDSFQAMFGSAQRQFRDIG